MKVFISWSGPRSEAIATVLRDWLPQVIQEIDPWMSKHDIPQGSVWRKELFAELAKVRFAVVCLTPENLYSQWMHFEAGAAAKEMLKDEKGAVCTYLLNLKNTDVKGPLADLQHTTADEESTRKLLTDINKLADRRLTEPVLKKAFDLNWPTLRDAIADISKRTYDESKPPERDLRDLVEELLENVRGMSSYLANSGWHAVPTLNYPIFYAGHGQASYPLVAPTGQPIQAVPGNWSFPQTELTIHPQPSNLSTILKGVMEGTTGTQPQHGAMPDDPSSRPVPPATNG